MADDGWRREAMRLRMVRAENCAAMNQLADLVEAWLKDEVDLPLLLLAFHHVAMDHEAYARKKTLRLALKSSVLKLSKRAPAIFPPDRVVHLDEDNRPKAKVRVRKTAALSKPEKALPAQRPKP